MKPNIIRYSVNRIELSEVDEFATLELLKVGEFEHPLVGKLIITKEILLEIKDNFDKNIHRLTDQDGRPMIPLNFSHEKGNKAAGWIKQLELNDEQNTLVGKIELTPIGREKVTNKEFAFASAEYNRDLRDPELKQNFKNVLTGAALTNIPYIRGMKSIELTQGELNMEEVLKLINGITDEQKVILVEKLRSMMSSDLDQSKQDNKNINLSQKDVELCQLQDEVKKLTKQNELQEKTLEFTQLLSAGKLVPAQKDAYLNNDIKKFVENAVDKDINFNQDSSDFKGKNPEKKIASVEDAESKIIELADIKMAADQSLDLGQAYSLVLKENKELNLINLTQ